MRREQTDFEKYLRNRSLIFKTVLVKLKFSLQLLKHSLKHLDFIK